MAMSKDLSVKSLTAAIVGGTGGQTYAGALAQGAILNGDITIVTCANASDSVGIPANLPAGTVFYIKNGAAAGLLWPPAGGAINGGTVDASKPLDVTIIYMVIVIEGGSASKYLVNKMAALSA